MGKYPKSVIVNDGTGVSGLKTKGGNPGAVFKHLQSYPVEEGLHFWWSPQSRLGTNKWMLNIRNKCNGGDQWICSLHEILLYLLIICSLWCYYFPPKKSDLDCQLIREEWRCSSGSSLRGMGKLSLSFP